MAWFPAKCGIEKVDPMADEDDHGHKVSWITSGQWFGKDMQFVPLSQSSQSLGQEEDDAQAADLIQGSQDMDNASTHTLYGMYPNRIHLWWGILINTRLFAHENHECLLL